MTHYLRTLCRYINYFLTYNLGCNAVNTPAFFCEYCFFLSSPQSQTGNRLYVTYSHVIYVAVCRPTLLRPHVRTLWARYLKNRLTSCVQIRLTYRHDNIDFWFSWSEVKVTAGQNVHFGLFLPSTAVWRRRFWSCVEMTVNNQGRPNAAGSIS